MKRLIMTALTAVFLSVIIQGCYTQFKSNEPKTGEKDYSDYQHYDDYYYNPYYYGMGWYQPYFYYPYPSFYGYMYSPWWYDPWYYYYDDGTHGVTPNTGKAIRSRDSRGGSIPQSPGFQYSPQTPYQPSGSGTVESKPPAAPPSNSNPPDKKETRESGKSTRGRR